MKKVFAYLPLTILIISTCLLTVGCSYSGELIETQGSTKDGKVQYAISFPDYMKIEKEKTLNENANLQYCSFYRNIYAVIIDEPSTTSNLSLTEYRQKELSQLQEVLNNPLKIDSAQLKVGGQEGYQIQLTGKVGEGETEKRIFYRLVFFEAKQHLFQIVLWGWDERRDQFIEDFDGIVNSFRLLTN